MSIYLASFKILEKSEKVSNPVETTKAVPPELGENNQGFLNSCRVALEYPQGYVTMFGIP